MKCFLDKNNIITTLSPRKKACLQGIYNFIGVRPNPVDNQFCEALIDSIAKAYGSILFVRFRPINFRNEANISGVDLLNSAMVQESISDALEGHKRCGKGKMGGNLKWLEVLREGREQGGESRLTRIQIRKEAGVCNLVEVSSFRAPVVVDKTWEITVGEPHWLEFKGCHTRCRPSIGTTWSILPILRSCAWASSNRLVSVRIRSSRILLSLPPP
ncbi:hypothetical protein LIER_41358 [Lithospermum erythrorhizon]|uniref:Uncharacterized protein n=1 Tax=Lithospermum erythrorhizon TaxID=34254 RepID=A0AAV3RA65_LITER